MNKIYQSASAYAANILSRNKLKQSLANLYKKGLPTGYNVGLKNLDEMFRLDLGRLITVTGIPNHGKSEFIDYLCAQYNKLYGFTTHYFSPENQPVELHASKLVSKFTGKPFDNDTIDQEELAAVSNYVFDNFIFMNYSKQYTLEDILKTAEYTIKNYGVKILVIDSYNKIENQKSMVTSETEYISQVLDKLVFFAQQMNVMVILVAHPKKMEKDGDGYKMPKAYDINGSANFYNKSDYCITVHRNYAPSYTTISVDKVKFKNYGTTGQAILGYDIRSGNFYDVDESITDLFNMQQLPTPPLVELNLPEEYMAQSTSDLLNVPVSFFTSCNSTNPSDVNLYDFITMDKYKDKIEHIRAGATLEEKKTRKNAASLPAVTVSTRMQGGRGAKYVVGHTNLMCIDIDYKDNVEIFPQIPEILQLLDYVCFYQLSASGQGYYAIVPIADAEDHRLHFNALYEEFKDLGITIDKQCSDEGRLRYYSYDENRFVKPYVFIYRDKKEKFEEKKFISNSTAPVEFKYVSPASGDKDKSSVMKELDGVCEKIINGQVNVCKGYDAWFQSGCGLAKTLGEDGRTYFHVLSQFYDGYSKDETDGKYDECLSSSEAYDYSIKSVFHFINQALKQKGA